MRDFIRQPYTADEKRVVNFLSEKVGIGAGDDPIGFIIASHETLAAERNELRRRLEHIHRLSHEKTHMSGSPVPIWGGPQA